MIDDTGRVQMEDRVYMHGGGVLCFCPISHGVGTLSARMIPGHGVSNVPSVLAFVMACSFPSKWLFIGWISFGVPDPR
jgi:hypothetical protein